ncbi:MAG: zinc ribbon domain-containing protein [Acidobacteria bacterium]|nr:zinc ribbon domain-containing protein [Acidobacteriota bacterium]
MPIFEYKCNDCGTGFEKLVRRAADSAEVFCPSCASKHLTQQLSTFAAHASGGPARAPMPQCPGGMCRTPEICGRN